MDFSPQQKRALSTVDAWMKTGDTQVFRLFGYAGSGKTTLAKHFAENHPGTMFAAFTGKAALVLRQKGCHGAQTIHSLIYVPCDKSKAQLLLYTKEAEELEKQGQTSSTRYAQLKRVIAEEEKSLRAPAFTLSLDSPIQDAPLVVIDEVSMVGTRLAEDLLSFGVKTLVLGDPAQLPPVADGGYFTEAEPDILLSEIHRQAKDSPIISLATLVRSGGVLGVGTYGDSRVTMKGMTTINQIAEEHDIILAGRNVTRRLVNGKVRKEVFGRTDPLPVPGDRLVCLRNNNELGLLNGSLWDVTEVSPIDDTMIGLNLVDPDSGDPIQTVAHTAPLLGQEVPWQRRRDADEFDYGYCLTTHKAQGSQWDSVYVVDESGCFRDDAAKWLYTAITRAAKRVTVAV